MHLRKKTQRKPYRRSLQLESLETRCLLAITAFTNLDAGITGDSPVSEPDTVIVGRATPASGTIEHDSDCGCSTAMVPGVIIGRATDSPLVEREVDEAVSLFDVTFVTDDPSQYVFDITMVQRTLADKSGSAGESTPDLTDEAIALEFQPESDETGVNDGISDEVDSEVDQAADGEVTPPMIYFTGSIVETAIGPEGKPAEVDGPAGPIIFRPTYETTGFDVPQDGHEEPGIYTLGGITTTTNDSQTDDSNSEEDVVRRDLSIPLTRQQRRELRAERRAERERARLERNLLATINNQPNRPTTVTSTTTSNGEQTTATNNHAQSLGGGIVQAVTAVQKLKHGGRRSGGRG